MVYIVRYLKVLAALLSTASIWWEVHDFIWESSTFDSVLGSKEDKKLSILRDQNNFCELSYRPYK